MLLERGRDPTDASDLSWAIELVADRRRIAIEPQGGRSRRMLGVAVVALAIVGLLWAALAVLR
jgi:hypothetical protein